MPDIQRQSHQWPVARSLVRTLACTCPGGRRRQGVWGFALPSPAPLPGPAEGMKGAPYHVTWEVV